MKIKELMDYIDGIIDAVEHEIDKLKDFRDNLDSLSDPLEVVSSVLEKLKRENKNVKTRKKKRISRLKGYIFVDEVEKTLGGFNKEAKASEVFKILPEKVKENHKPNAVYNTLWNYAQKNDRFYKNGNKFGLIKWKQTGIIFDEKKQLT